jgi:DNA-binding MarR family transcriptional regulator
VLDVGENSMSDPVSAERTAERLLALMPRFADWAAASLRAKRDEGDPSFRQLIVLFQIRNGATSPVALANRLGISRAVVTGLLDRLEQRGFVQREADPTDRRRLRLVVTPAGIAASQRLGRAVVADLARQLATGDAVSLAALATALPLLEQSIDALHAQTPATDDAPGSGDPWDEAAPSVQPTALAALPA